MTDTDRLKMLLTSNAAVALRYNSLVERILSNFTESTEKKI